MARPKETPRQKMIGMMYLVYTSMLAMNVSADLLDAFVLVDSGLTQTTRNYAAKNKATVSTFAEAELLNPGKVGVWREKADSVHSKSQAIIDFVRDLKYTLVLKSDGEKSPAFLDDAGNPLPNKGVDGSKVATKADRQTSPQIMIQEGNGAKLRGMIEEYREYLLKQIDPRADSSLYANVAEMLNTSAPPPTKDGIQHTWESHRFEHVPMIASLPQLTKVQVDVLNAEADVMGFLLSRIDAGDFKFNRIGAVVIPSSDYVMRGDQFTAEVFLAASDTTQRPVVYVGSYDSTYSETMKEWVYEMRPGYDTLPVTAGGRGVLRRPATANGTVNWGGLIEIHGPDGGVIRKPFKHTYTVAEPSFAVSATKMNVLYKGVPNPIEVSVSGASSAEVQVSMTNGSISRSGKGYIAQPSSSAREGSIANIAVAVGSGANRKSMGSKQFRIKSVPDPIAGIFGMTVRDQISKAQLASAQGIEAKMPPDFDFDMKFRVLGFTVSATVGGYVVEQAADGPQFNARQRQLIGNLNPGMQVAITNIRAQGPDGKVRNLQPMVLRVR